mgnify:CR=1 FL=1
MLCTVQTLLNTPFCTAPYAFILYDIAGKFCTRIKGVQLMDEGKMVDPELEAIYPR